MEYKYIVKTSDNSEVEWQPGENEVARISGGSDGLEIVDEWVTEESGGEAEAEGEPAVDVDDAVAAGGAAEKDAGLPFWARRLWARRSKNIPLVHVSLDGVALPLSSSRRPRWWRGGECCRSPLLTERLGSGGRWETPVRVILTGR